MEYDFLNITGVDSAPPEPEEIMQHYADSMWIQTKKGSFLNENTFAEAFRDINNMMFSNGLFYTSTGRKTEELIQRDIWESIKDVGVNQNVEQTVKKLLGAVKLSSIVPELTVSPTVIPLHNGDLDISNWTFYIDRASAVPYRFPVDLRRHIQDTPNFTKWLNDLFDPEDRAVFQEYLGYCLIPSTQAQKALFLVGDGGAGKSVVGVILESLLGDGVLNVSSTQEFLADKFKLAELENKLVLYDDDLDSAALTGTGLYKKLITNNISVMADRKYGQPFKFTPHVKLVSCCNEMLTSLYDNSEGFYRRLLPIQIKPKAADFKPDLDFYNKIRAESEGILQWALVGLARLQCREWALPESGRTKNYLQGKSSQGNHFPEFMSAVFDFAPGLSVTTEEVMRIYKAWCKKNAYDERKPRAVQTWIADNAEKYQIVRSQHVHEDGKQVRGYFGMDAKGEWGNAIGKIRLVGQNVGID